MTNGAADAFAGVRGITLATGTARQAERRAEDAGGKGLVKPSLCARGHAASRTEAVVFIGKSSNLSSTL